MKHKSGFVSIIGNPNSGKSTLLNALIGTNLSIVTKKIQTTRHRIFGIYNEKNYQIIFSDTPGFVESNYRLHQKMMNSVKESLRDSDVIIFINAINELKKNNNKILNQLINLNNIPIIILINKIDLINNLLILQKNINYWNHQIPNSLILSISALKKINLNLIINEIKKYIPESPPFFNKNQITNRSQRFFANEIIRKYILINYKKEIPYCVEVVTEFFNEKNSNIEIHAIIYVERDSQKGIIIGYKGHSINKVNKQSTLEMNIFFQKKIILSLYVKIKKNWRKNNSDLINFGYNFK